jgi:hypothetical protein
MPRRLLEDLNARIEAEVARHPDGVGIDDLHAVLAHIASRRTLQRRLASMVEQQRIRAEVSIRLRTESSPSATASPVRPVTACRHWC